MTCDTKVKLTKGQRRILYAIPLEGWTNPEAASALERPRTSVSSRQSELIKLGLLDRDTSVVPWRYFLSDAGRDWLIDNAAQQLEDRSWLQTDLADARVARELAELRGPPRLTIPAGTDINVVKWVVCFLDAMFRAVRLEEQHS